MNDFFDLLSCNEINYLLVVLNIYFCEFFFISDDFREIFEDDVSDFFEWRIKYNFGFFYF